MIVKRRAALLSLGLLLTACGGDAGREANPSAGAAATSSASGAGGSSGAGGAGGSASNACPHGGQWSLCAVRERLDRSGLVPLPPTDSLVRRPFLRAPGVVYALGQAQLEVYVYSDSSAVARDVAALDTVAVAPRGQRGQWPAPPTFIRSANLIAVLLTANERQIERVQLALTAGPPMADRPGEQQSR